jgi:predicted nucleic acid-binding protein
MVLVDSNVILDVVTRDPVWAAWSDSTLEECAETDSLAVNPLIYAEVSVGYARIEELESVLTMAGIQKLPLPWEAAFIAGKCFQLYRRSGGAKRSPLPDFYIGAHALIAGMRLITRDASRYRTYFPNLRLICPNDTGEPP